MNNEQVEVVNAPIPKLLFADGFDTVAIVKGVPQLGNDEKLFALDNSFLDGACNALTRFDLIAIIWIEFSLGTSGRWKGSNTYHKLHPKGGNLT